MDEFPQNEMTVLARMTAVMMTNCIHRLLMAMVRSIERNLKVNRKSMVEFFNYDGIGPKRRWKKCSSPFHMALRC